MEQEKKRIFSGIQPSGCITLGNYLGALKNWVALQDEYECIYSVVDLHSITVRQDPAALRKNAMDLLAEYLACGIDPEKSLMFIQSHVSAHAELGWILNCFTYMGELSRMTQFKDKSKKHEDNINAGLFTYPCLMAADILLYQADLVPIGEDQRQHLELTRDLAHRFNTIYGDVFTVPESFIPKMGARVMSLATPTAKMSKSDPNPNGFIALLDPPDVIMRKVKRAVTDSDGEIAYRDDKPGIKNLLNIYCACTGISLADALESFEGKGYGDLKTAVGEAVVASLEPIQNRYADLIKNKDYLQEVYRKGAEAASYIAMKTLRKVHKKLGYIQR